ncbi:MarR family winged helix-turn-helix transcriptional regulator [Bosea sp. NPDC003192]|uniref:MarR family winged helix-turn-helix transcriptional regulator n=1 Tax=Bosea sp. NPDC003192 TaxID=3390551 RepID=UPI003CFCF69B
MTAASAESTRRFEPPLTVSHAALLNAGSDLTFRDTLYLMVLSLGRFQACREAFGRSIGLTGSQFAVLLGVAYRQGEKGVTIRDLAEHVHLASTHVTTEVGQLIRKGFLVKRPNAADRRSVLVQLAKPGEEAVVGLAPFMRDVNDLLFKDVTRDDMGRLREIFQRIVLNSEYALAELRRHERSELLDN